jgi:hypothetical protein
MRPDRISEILDLALEARNVGQVFTPMFVGEAGLGKSQIIQQWVKEQQKKDPEFGFIDCRIAYYEGPDFVGYPSEQDVEGILRMVHALPEMWPSKGRGLLLFEEPNRGTTMVMNCLMQILTDRKIGHKYVLPEGWLIAAAINPEGAKYDVNNMDTALKDRFEEFPVEYDFQAFMFHVEEGVQKGTWHSKVANYLKSGVWVYKTPDAVAKDGKYISPRTWSKMNAAELAGASSHSSKQSTHRIIAQAILGKHVGNEYWKTCWDDAPILASDILADSVKALAKLKQQSKSGDTYAGDKVAVTVDSIIGSYGGFFSNRKKPDGSDWSHEDGTIDEPTMVAIASIIPADHAINLIKGCGYKVHKGQVASYMREFSKRNPQCVDLMRDAIKLDRAVNK